MIRNKTPELTKAKNALVSYLKKHNLSPFKDWSKDPIHGEVIRELTFKLNKERDKVAAIYPAMDKGNQLKLISLSSKRVYKMKKEKAKKEGKEPKKIIAKVVEKPAKKEEEVKEKAKKATQKYDYPLIDGREMTSIEKKKYRMEQRRLAQGKEQKPKKEEKVEAKAKDSKKIKKEEVTPKKKLVKKVKSKKDED